jgi:hypothetical protein
MKTTLSLVGSVLSAYLAGYAITVVFAWMYWAARLVMGG